MKLGNIIIVTILTKFTCVVAVHTICVAATVVLARYVPGKKILL